MSRSLFIVNSVYHLLTAVNLRRQGSAGEEAHLLLTDVTPGLRERIPSPWRSSRLWRPRSRSSIRTPGLR